MAQRMALRMARRMALRMALRAALHTTLRTTPRMAQREDIRTAPRTAQRMDSRMIQHTTGRTALRRMQRTGSCAEGTQHRTQSTRRNQRTRLRTPHFMKITMHTTMDTMAIPAPPHQQHKGRQQRQSKPRSLQRWILQRISRPMQMRANPPTHYQNTSGPLTTPPHPHMPLLKCSFQ